MGQNILYGTHEFVTRIKLPVSPAHPEKREWLYPGISKSLGEARLFTGKPCNTVELKEGTLRRTIERLFVVDYRYVFNTRNS